MPNNKSKPALGNKCKEKKGHFATIWSLLRKCNGRRILVQIILASLLNAIIGLSGPIALALVTDSLIQKTNPFPAFIIMIASLLLGIVVSYFRQKTCNGSTVYFTSKLKSLLNQKLYKLAIGDVEQIQTGGVLNLYSLDVSKVAQWSGTSWATFLELIFYILGAIVYMIYENFTLTTILVPTVILFLPLLARLSKKITTYSKDERVSTDKFLAQTYDLLSNPEMVRAWSINGQIYKKTDSQLNTLYAIKYKKSKTTALNNATSFIISNIPGFVTAFIGTYFCFTGRITIGFTIALIQMMMGGFAFVFPRFNSFILETRENIVSAQRIEFFLNKREYTKSIKFSETKSKRDRHNEAVVFENFTLRYPDGTIGNQNLSLTIKVGERVCFAGLSGSGKSTALKAMLSYYPYQENTVGNIWLNGKNLDEMTPDEICTSFSPVFQDNHLFDGSISENMSLNTDSEGCKLLMEKLGLYSLSPNISVGENGSQVSGGQRQRVAIGRAIVKAAPIYVFDEPTSALDEQMEEQIIQVAMQLTQGKTVIFVSHRPALLKGCDHIFFFKNGCVIEEGSHDELILQNGAYTGMFRSKGGLG